MKAENRKVFHEQEVEKCLVTLLGSDSDGTKIAASQAISALCENLSCKEFFNTQGKQTRDRQFLKASGLLRWGCVNAVLRLCVWWPCSGCVDAALRLSICSNCVDATLRLYGWVWSHGSHSFLCRDSTDSSVAQKWQWGGEGSCRTGPGKPDDQQPCKCQVSTRTSLGPAPPGCDIWRLRWFHVFLGNLTFVVLWGPLWK